MQSTSGVKILSGASLSNELDLTGQVVTAIHMPAGWDSAAITVVASDKPTTEDEDYDPVYSSAGTELSLTVAANRVIYLDPSVTRGLRFVKLRSGTAGAAVNQTADRVFTVTVEPSGGG